MDRCPPGNRVQLATVSPEGIPSVRTVILRGLSDDGTAWFVTDARTEKVAELERNPRVALHVFWPDGGEQFRLSGRARVHGARADAPFDALRAEFWAGLSAETKRLFFGPPPGRQLGPLPPPPADFVACPPEFAVVGVDVDEVDWLRLGAPPVRWLYRGLGGEWIEEEVGP